jgi:hypothetical protein
VTLQEEAMSQVPARIARIGAVTAKTPVLISAAATAATAKVIDWELRQLARSPLTAEARRLDRHYRELAATPRPRAAPQTAWTEITQPVRDAGR